MRALAGLIPYLAMALGLHLWHNAWLSFLLYHGLVLLLLRRDRAQIGMLRGGWDARLAAAAVLFGAAGGALLYVLIPAVGIEPAVFKSTLARLGLDGGGWVLFICYHALVNPWFEEVLWRGYLGSDSRWPVAGDFLFAGYHALVLAYFLDPGWIALSCGALTVAGWFWRQLRRRRQGLLLPVISHLAADASIMAAACVVSRG